MMIRKGIKEDISGILDLQEINLVTNLNNEEKRNGFVTTPFLYEQIELLVEKEGIFIISNNSKISGYAVAAGWDYFTGRPMFDFMLKRFSNIKYKNIQISTENSFEYGPVCIDLKLRGSGAFPELFNYMKREMSKKYVIGTTFINKINERSFRAHTKKANIDVIDNFEFNNNCYYGLAFSTR